jgi:4-hydroxy-tetrahydrodipicolinate synthase
MKWEGIFPALTTKFTKDDLLDHKALHLNIDAQIDAGVDGIILCGSLGESSTLNRAEKLELIQYAVKHAGLRVPVLLNIAESSTDAAIHMANAAEELGAKGVMLLPPLLYKSSPRETVDFFIDVCKGSNLPIMIYNNPVDYRTEVSIDMFSELLRYDQIQAVKESTRDISNVSRLKNRFGDRLKVLSGVDTIATESLIMGADGWVAGLVDAFPKETVAIYRLIRAGRIQEAIKIHRWFLPVLELDIHPKLVQNIKLAEVMTGLGTENVRPPRQKLTGEERARVIKIIGDAIECRPKLPDYLSL